MNNIYKKITILTVSALSLTILSPFTTLANPTDNQDTLDLENVLRIS